MIKILYDFFVCYLASFFFGILFRTPKKNIFAASFLGGMGYVIYYAVYSVSSLVIGYFAGTLFISIFSEVLARYRKTPALIFITPAVIPLVPGAGLYETMRYFVYGDVINGIAKCIETLSCAGVMAVAIALPPMVIKVLRVSKENKNQN
ncbi:MAG: threonine/serine exporter family protein [Clostridia bacterium]|nr:threonine/serine exporter family protein [Clostridia bacterium]